MRDQERIALLREIREEEFLQYEMSKPQYWPEQCLVAVLATSILSLLVLIGYAVVQVVRS